MQFINYYLALLIKFSSRKVQQQFLYLVSRSVAATLNKEMLCGLDRRQVSGLVVVT